MPIDNSKSHSEIVAELMQTYKKTDKIGNTKPKNKQDALNIANTIAFKAKEDK